MTVTRIGIGRGRWREPGAPVERCSGGEERYECHEHPNPTASGKLRRSPEEETRRDLDPKRPGTNRLASATVATTMILAAAAT